MIAAARLIAVATLLAPALGLAQATTWKMDAAHTQSTFTVRHLGITNVTGEFRSTNGTVVVDEKDPSKSKVEATIDAKSIHTREDKRDAHLRSPDFFDVEKFPTITFKSTKVEKKGDEKFEVTGDLTMHGVTKPVKLETTLTKPIKGPMGETRRGATAATTVDRREFGLNWNKAVEAVPVVGDDVKIEIQSELVQEGTGTQPAAAKK
jgi:polyisoprenoid-binding protein YceI